MKTAEIKRLIYSGLFSYGSEMDIVDFADLFDISVPSAYDRTIYSIMSKFNLALLIPYAQVNDILLTMGRKLKREGNMFVVPSIGATLKYVDYYEDKAAKARLRAKKLRTSFWLAHPSYISSVDRSKEAKRHNIEISAVSAAGPSI